MQNRIEFHRDPDLTNMTSKQQVISNRLYRLHKVIEARDRAVRGGIGLKSCHNRISASRLDEMSKIIYRRLLSIVPEILAQFFFRSYFAVIRILGDIFS